MTEHPIPEEAVEAVLRHRHPEHEHEMLDGARDAIRSSIRRELQAAAPAIRDDMFRKLRLAADALENDPAADPGTYVHDVECAILRGLKDGS